MVTIPKHPIRPIITLAALAAATGLVACGGSGDDQAEAQQNAQDASLEFAKCMREHGVDIPDPEASQGGGGGGFQLSLPQGANPQSDEFQKASDACRSILEDAIPEGERPDPAEMRDQLHQMTECLRDKGYDVPEPQIFGPGDDPPDNPQPPSQDLQDLMDDPDFQQAQQDCGEQADLPGGGPGIQVGPGGGDQGPSTSSDSGEGK